MNPQVLTGGCYCSAVRYQITGSIRGVVNCHCTQCQKLNGNFGAHIKTDSQNLSVTHDHGLRWFQISDGARRGFCKRCGSALFWQATGQTGTGIVAGSLDNSDQIQTIGHIFVAEKPTYTIINDNLPQYSESSDGALPGDHVGPVC